MIKDYDRQEGLLFYMSGDASAKAEFAKGQAEPNFEHGVEVKNEGGADGGYVCCSDYQAYSYLAPGNIYAERGTLSFFWRSRYPVGPTEFPIFRVSYVDHTSWDACFLRIDYNGHGLDAFVTDLNLSRARVSIGLDPFPAPDEWMHIAFSWDENFGVKLYVNGEKKAELSAPACTLPAWTSSVRIPARSRTGMYPACITLSAAVTLTKWRSLTACSRMRTSQRCMRRRCRAKCRH